MEEQRVQHEDSGCGTGRAVVSDTRVSWAESSFWQLLFTFNYIEKAEHN